MKRSDFMLGGRDFTTLVAAQVMETNISRVTENAPWREAARIMAEHFITSLPVVDNKNRLLGLITEYDILRPIAKNQDITKLTASDILSKDVQTVSEDTPALEVLRMFDEKRVFKILVVEKGALTGVIVKHDVILAYLNATEEPPKGF